MGSNRNVIVEPLHEVLNFEQKGFTLANTSVILWVCQVRGGQAEEDAFDLISLTAPALFTKFSAHACKVGGKGEEGYSKQLLLHFEETRAAAPPVTGRRLEISYGHWRSIFILYHLVSSYRPLLREEANRFNPASATCGLHGLGKGI